MLIYAWKKIIIAILRQRSGVEGKLATEAFSLELYYNRRDTDAQMLLFYRKRSFKALVSNIWTN